MQRIEIRNPIQPDPDNLSVKNCGAFDMCRGIDNQRVALRTIRTIDCVEPHPSIPDMDLQPVLELVRPTRSRLGAAWRRLADTDE